jgi:large subunit ribosomal protein L15
MKLHDLVPNPGSKKNKKRVGRGISAGQGKTAGRGTKGQGARSGEGGKIYRQGGNLPFYRRLPFMRGQGFTPLNRIEYNEVNLDQLTESFKAGAEVTPETLASAHLLRDPRNPVVILGRGDVSVALKVRVHRITAGAKAKIEQAGGTVELIGS